MQQKHTAGGLGFWVAFILRCPVVTGQNTGHIHRSAASQAHVWGEGLRKMSPRIPSFSMPDPFLTGFASRKATMGVIRTT